MKKLKGFTLIELIVVIAIIGVLAAILVPALIGYVKKSKITSANASASSCYKAINSALVGLNDGQDYEANSYLITSSHGDMKFVIKNGTAPAGFDGIEFYKLVMNYFTDIKRCTTYAKISDGECKAVALATTSTITGSYPTILNYKNYKYYTIEDACIQAYNKASNVTVTQPSNKVANNGF